MSDIVYTYEVPEKIPKGTKTWTDKSGKQFIESYCEACEVMSIKCQSCGLGSCSGGACDYCDASFKEYIEVRYA